MSIQKFLVGQGFGWDEKTQQFVKGDTRINVSEISGHTIGTFKEKMAQRGWNTATAPEPKEQQPNLDVIFMQGMDLRAQAEWQALWASEAWPMGDLSGLMIPLLFADEDGKWWNDNRYTVSKEGATPLPCRCQLCLGAMKIAKQMRHEFKQMRHELDAAAYIMGWR